ncbi:MAG TPA: peptidoglycan DD-metalloendopeptidase family protein [Burkholderiales bacterium]|nr:peptidoglycan DD-metalloendopeptidase family protein [Burkholderiales bacterium]
MADLATRTSITPVRIGCFAAAFAVLFASQPASTQTQQNAELNELRSKIEQLQKELEKSEEYKSEAADALRKSERAISKANRRLFELANERKSINTRIRQLENKAARLEKRIDSERESLARLIHRQYLAGQPESLRLMLNRQNANETARQLHYFGYVSKARAELIGALRNNLDELSDLTQAVQAESARLQKLEKEESGQKKALEKQKRARKKVLSKASSDIALQRNQISKLKRDEQRLTALIKKLAAEAEKRRQQARLKNQSLPDASANNSAFRKLKGKLRLPVIGELTNRFGRPRKDSGLSWKGLFIAAKEGGVVKAIAPGQVVYADWLRGFGNLLILDHGSGYMSLYGNNESLFRQVGDRLGAGETIASVGNSGGNPDSGLYFELRHKGKPFDPLPWVNLK